MGPGVLPIFLCNANISALLSVPSAILGISGLSSGDRLSMIDFVRAAIIRGFATDSSSSCYARNY